MTVLENAGAQLGSGVLDRLSADLCIPRDRIEKVAERSVLLLLACLTGRFGSRSVAGPWSHGLDLEGHRAPAIAELEPSGSALLERVLAEFSPSISRSLGGRLDLTEDATRRLLATLAPVVLRAVDDEARRLCLDAASLDDLLGTEADRIEALHGDFIRACLSCSDDPCESNEEATAVPVLRAVLRRSWSALRPTEGRG